MKKKHRTPNTHSSLPHESIIIILIHLTDDNSHSESYCFLRSSLGKAFERKMEFGVKEAKGRNTYTLNDSPNKYFGVEFVFVCVRKRCVSYLLRSFPSAHAYILGLAYHVLRILRRIRIMWALTGELIIIHRQYSLRACFDGWQSAAEWVRVCEGEYFLSQIQRLARYYRWQKFSSRDSAHIMPSRCEKMRRFVSSHEIFRYPLNKWHIVFLAGKSTHFQPTKSRTKMRVRVTGSHTIAIDNTISCITHRMYCSTFMCLHARARVHIVFLLRSQSK